jgi:hypothetical protein
LKKADPDFSRMAAFPWTTLVVTMAAAFSGCVGDEPVETESKPLVVEEAPAPKTTHLRVLVITDEYLPIVGAKVSVTGLGLNATTNEVGSAYFQIGTPGRYAVHVHRAGFYPNISKVSIEGDEKQVERITLYDAPRDAHFSDFRYFPGVCEVKVYVSGVSTDSRCEEHGLGQRSHPKGWFLGQGLQSGYLRLHWEAQTYGSDRMRLEVAFPEAGAFANGEEYLVVEGTAPLLLELSPSLLTPAMQKNGLPIDVWVGLAADTPVASNLYQPFEIEAQFDYFQKAPDVDHH